MATNEGRPFWVKFGKWSGELNILNFSVQCKVLQDKPSYSNTDSQQQRTCVVSWIIKGLINLVLWILLVDLINVKPENLIQIW